MHLAIWPLFPLQVLWACSCLVENCLGDLGETFACGRLGIFSHQATLHPTGNQIIAASTTMSIYIIHATGLQQPVPPSKFTPCRQIVYINLYHQVNLHHTGNQIIAATTTMSIYIIQATGLQQPVPPSKFTPYRQLVNSSLYHQVNLHHTDNWLTAASTTKWIYTIQTTG